LGFTSLQVVPSIILSMLSAGVGIFQLLLTGTADLLEPAVNGVLALTETGKDKVLPGADIKCSPCWDGVMHSG
jgi:hypothetical protein